MATTKSNTKIITARAQHVLVTPRKANLLLKAIVGRPATLVLKQLAVIPKRASDPVAKLIKQAIGNAVSLHSASPDSLIIDSAYATKGRTLKRAQIGGRGRTKPYERTASHLTLNLRVLDKQLPQPHKVEKVAAEVKTEAPKTKAVKTKKNTK